MNGKVPKYIYEIMDDFKFEKLNLDKQAAYAYKQNKGSYGYMFLVTPRKHRHFLPRSTYQLFDRFLKWCWEKQGAETCLLKRYEDFEHRKGYAFMEVSITDPVAQFIEKQMEEYRNNHRRSVSSSAL